MFRICLAGLLRGIIFFNQIFIKAHRHNIHSHDDRHYRHVF